MSRKRKPFDLNALNTAVSRHRREQSKRVGDIKLEVEGEWESFRLMDGAECILRWGDSDKLGNLEGWLAFELLPMLYGLAKLVDLETTRPKGSRPNLIEPIVLKQIQAIS